MLTYWQDNLGNTISSPNHLIVNKHSCGRWRILDDKGLLLLFNNRHWFCQYQNIRSIALQFFDSIVSESHHYRKKTLSKHFHLSRTLWHIHPSFIAMFYQRGNNITFYFRDTTYKLYFHQCTILIIQILTRLSLSRKVTSYNLKRFYRKFL